MDAQLLTHRGAAHILLQGPYNSLTPLIFVDLFYSAQVKYYL